MKKIGISIIGVLLVGITIGVIYTKNFTEDQNKSRQKTNQIKENNNQLKVAILSYNQNKKEITKGLSIYYEEQFIKDYPNLIDLFNQNESLIQSISQNEKILTSNCQNQIYQDKEVNQICNTHSKTYQKLLEVYQKDIKSLNKMIELYNEGKEDKLALFQSQYGK